MSNTNAVLMGKLGEAIVAHEFGGILSENKFDMEKDMTFKVSNDEAEVKMQNRHRAYSCFSVPLPQKNKHTNQLKKCLGVKRLFFVEYEVDGSDRIRIWECVDRNYFTYSTLHGRMAGFKIENMILHKDFNNPKIAEKARLYSQARKI